MPPGLRIPPPHIGSNALGSSPPHFRSLTVANRDYLHRIDFPFQSNALVCGPSYHSVCLRTNMIDFFNSDLRTLFRRNSHRVPLAPISLTLSRVGANAIFPSATIKLGPGTSPTRLHTRRARTSSRRTLQHRTLDIEPVSLSYEGRIAVLRPRVNRGT